MLSLNRTAVVVTAKQPFLDWLHSVDPTSRELSLVDVNEDPDVYLVPECDNNDEAVRHGRRLCQEILAEQIEGWWREPSAWPKRLDYRLFTRWFECRYHSMVFDLAKRPLIREEIRDL